MKIATPELNTLTPRDTVVQSWEKVTKKLALDENPTTGYTWQEEFDDSFLIVKRILTESYPRTYK